MPGISQIKIQTPEYKYSLPEILEAAQKWLNASPAELNLFARFVQSSQIATRSFVLPLEEILKLHGSKARADAYQEFGSGLACKVVTDVLKTGQTPESFGALVYTSCTAPLVPTLDTAIVNRCGFSPKIERLPVYQHGCAGGAVGLSLASRFASCGVRTMLVSVELCSLGFQRADLTGGGLVGSALFADGAACVVVEPNDATLKICATRSYLIPNSEYLMGYDIKDQGTHLRLDKELPKALAAVSRDLVPEFLAEQGLKPQDINWWLIHPGGAKILDTLESAFSLDRSQLRWSWEALTEYGNLSSASLLFVASRFLTERAFKKGDYVLMLGVGPGLTVQLNLFQAME